MPDRGDCVYRLCQASYLNIVDIFLIFVDTEYSTVQILQMELGWEGGIERKFIFIFIIHKLEKLEAAKAA